jgi:hypothetical protein
MGAWVPLAIGQRATSARTFGCDEVKACAAITDDRNPLHFDPTSRRPPGSAARSSTVA